MIKIGFDIGGCISKYPELVDLIFVLVCNRSVEVHIISDMHPKDKILDMLKRNGLHNHVLEPYVHAADYTTHGENCKAVLCKELELDILVDDYIGYVATPGCPSVRLLVMPDPSLPYYHDNWNTDGSEGDFGRRHKS